MKRTMLEELWNGQIAPYKDCGENDPEVEALAELIARNKISLEAALTDQQKNLLGKYVAGCDEYHYLMTVHAFRSGFSLAGRLLTEALT